MGRGIPRQPPVCLDDAGIILRRRPLPKIVPRIAVPAPLQLCLYGPPHSDRCRG